MNCWVAAKRKAAGDDEALRDEIADVVEENMSLDKEEDPTQIADQLLESDDSPFESDYEDSKEDDDSDTQDERTAREIFYEERWQPKYERSARRVPFGHSRRLTAVVMEFLDQHEYLKVTQPTMMNIVEDAAEHAEGVDPNKITIRGLRATAATHTATYIRHPKALQDIMGWTRIETASRYLRRAGAFTTDIVYHAFRKGDIAPAMYPGEPQEQYPLVANPLPYQREPFDPMLFSKSVREERASQSNPISRALIHPRSHRPPDNFHYDPSNHAIRTHEDYASDFIERDDGSLALERPTLSDVIENHERLPEPSSKRRHESVEEWENERRHRSDIGDIFSEDDQQSRTLTPFPATLKAVLGTVDRAAERSTTAMTNRYGDETIEPPKSPVLRTLFWIIGVVCAAIMMLFALVQAGFIELETMSIEASSIGILALLFVLLIAYYFYKTGSLTGSFK
ncbi:tyrosine-type recombinase/integrase [Natrialba sp. SSL1]|uniref:tyrosine-type recombinase/integrase n=1 Tax=Natrialba sp. SSL1 TaxID=1869245 RepID=UPI0008F8BC0B|nr:tyrosine-type recombinase/integrase [Natrialba sp. SSL1]OIB58768.1 hypothetical protein BBD46_06855 [Natrialba sp. SSL1]